MTGANGKPAGVSPLSLFMRTDVSRCSSCGDDHVQLLVRATTSGEAYVICPRTGQKVYVVEARK